MVPEDPREDDCLERVASQGWAICTLRRAAQLLLFVLTAALAGCGEDLIDPSIEAILPQQGAVGAAVDILGQRFEGRRRFVSFGGVRAPVLMWQERRVRVYVPPGPPGHTAVVVTVDGRPSNPVDFSVE